MRGNDRISWLTLIAGYSIISERRRRTASSRFPDAESRTGDGGTEGRRDGRTDGRTEGDTPREPTSLRFQRPSEDDRDLPSGEYIHRWRQCELWNKLRKVS